MLKIRGQFPCSKAKTGGIFPGGACKMVTKFEQRDVTISHGNYSDS